MSRSVPFVAVLALLVNPAFAGPGHEHDHGKAAQAHGPGKLLGTILPPYLAIHKALVAGDLAAVKAAAPKLLKVGKAHHLEGLVTEAEKLPAADLPASREIFKTISGMLAPVVLVHPPARQAFRVFDCEKAPGQWVQIRQAPKNPFVTDKALLDCGTLVNPPAKRKKKGHHHGPRGHRH